MSAELPQVNEAELALIKRTFMGNEALLKSIRALFLGLDVSMEEKKMIKATFEAPDVMQIMRNRFYPTISKDTPIGQIQDAWLGVENMVFGQAPHAIEQAVNYKEIALKHTAQALDLLVNPDGERPDLVYNALKHPNDPLQVNLLARNQFIRHVEQQLLFLHLIASQKDKTPEEIKKTTQKDSSQ